jgi:hypothetical protein
MQTPQIQSILIFAARYFFKDTSGSTTSRRPVLLLNRLSSVEIIQLMNDSESNLPRRRFQEEKIPMTLRQ